MAGFLTLTYLVTTNFEYIKEHMFVLILTAKLKLILDFSSFYKAFSRKKFYKINSKFMIYEKKLILFLGMIIIHVNFQEKKKSLISQFFHCSNLRQNLLANAALKEEVLKLQHTLQTQSFYLFQSTKSLPYR